MTELAAPFVSTVSGIATRGRYVRVTLDAERWWYRLPTREATYTYPNGPEGGVPPTLSVASRTRGRRSTYVRLGMEIPLARQGFASVTC